MNKLYEAHGCMGLICYLIGRLLFPDFDNEAPYAKLGSISGLMASCWGVV